MSDFLTGLTIAIATFFTSLTNPQSSPSPSPLPSISPIPVSIQETIERTGGYASPLGSISYKLNIPKNGGVLSGEVEGVCNGPIKGYFEGGNDGKINGNSKVICKVGLLSQDLDILFSGKTNLSEGKADLDWSGQIPFTKNSGSFTLYFDPIR